MPVEIKILGCGDEALLEKVAAGVFDHDVDGHLTEEFLRDARHHLAVAVEDGLVIGFVSAVHYVHPDKRPELWINEVAVAPTHQRRGLGKALLSSMLKVGRQFGCVEAWVLTDRSNTPATRLYSSLGGRESDPVMFAFKLTAGEPRNT
jgi:ribosomal protein S18 acetylase RimI-like enzyme